MVVTSNHITIYSISNPYLKFNASNIGEEIFIKNKTYAMLNYWVKFGSKFGRGDLILFKQDSKVILTNENAIKNYYFTIHDTNTQLPFSNLFIGSDIKLNITKNFQDQNKVMINITNPISIYDKVNTFIFGVTDLMLLSTFPSKSGTLKMFLMFVHNDWLRYYFSEYNSITNVKSKRKLLRTEPIRNSNFTSAFVYKNSTFYSSDYIK